MSGRLDAKALTLQDAGHDGAEIRVGVHEENPPAMTGGARGELVSHERPPFALVDDWFGKVMNRAQP